MSDAEEKEGMGEDLASSAGHDDAQRLLFVDGLSSDARGLVRLERGEEREERERERSGLTV